MKKKVVLVKDGIRNFGGEGYQSIFYNILIVNNCVDVLFDDDGVLDFEDDMGMLCHAKLDEPDHGINGSNPELYNIMVQCYENGWFPDDPGEFVVLDDERAKPIL